MLPGVQINALAFSGYRTRIVSSVSDGPVSLLRLDILETNYCLLEESHLIFIKTVRDFPLEVQKGQRDRSSHGVKTTRSQLDRGESLLL